MDNYRRTSPKENFTKLLSQFVTQGNNVIFYRGFIDQNNTKSVDRSRSKVSIKELYDRQQKGEKVDIHTYESPFANQLIWGVPKWHKKYASVVVGSRFLARLAVNSEFRQNFINNPDSVRLQIATCKAKEADVYLFTEESDLKIYPLHGNKNRITEAHVIAEKADLRELKTISPIGVKSLISWLSNRAGDFNWRNLESLIYSAGYSNEELNKVMLHQVCEDKNGKDRNFLDAANIASNLALKKSQGKLTQDQIEDLIARGLSQFLSLGYDPELVQPKEYKFEGKPKIPHFDENELFIENGLNPYAKL